MSIYKMKKIKFEHNADVKIPGGSLDIHTVWDPKWDCWALVYLELIVV
jgi:hypothetical protein